MVTQSCISYFSSYLFFGSFLLKTKLWYIHSVLFFPFLSVTLGTCWWFCIHCSVLCSLTPIWIRVFCSKQNWWGEDLEAHTGVSLSDELGSQTRSENHVICQNRFKGHLLAALQRAIIKLNKCLWVLTQENVSLLVRGQINGEAHQGLKTPFEEELREWSFA